MQSFWWQEMTTSTLWSCIHYAFIFHIKLISRRKCVQYTEESYTTTWYEEIIHKKSKNIFYIYSEFFNNFDKLCVCCFWMKGFVYNVWMLRTNIYLHQLKELFNEIHRFHYLNLYYLGPPQVKCRQISFNHCDLCVTDYFRGNRKPTLSSW